MEAALISRLERAVERLEGLQVVGPTTNSAGARAQPAAIGAKQPVVAAKPQPQPPPPPPPPPAVAASSAGGDQILAAYDAYITAAVAPLAQLTAAFPEPVPAAVGHYATALREARGVLASALGTPKPTGVTGLQALLAPVARALVAATQLADSAPRRGAALNALKVVAEAVQAVSWMAYTGPDCGMAPPAQHVPEAWHAAEFYANKLLMECRGGTPPAPPADVAVAWVKGMKESVARLETFVAAHCADGLVWGTMTAKPAGPPGAPARAPPPPPPPPPPGPPPKPVSVQELAGVGGGGAGKGPSAAAAGGNMAALFAELQKGEAITQGLKKVTDDMKTKNRADRGPGVVAVASSPAAAAAPLRGSTKAAAATSAAGPPRCEFDADRKKWVVENQVGARQLTVDVVAPSHGVYIYNCRDSVVRINGKANVLSVDSCAKTGVVFGDLISAVEVVNSRSLQLQCTGYVPTVSIEKTDGAQLYLRHGLVKAHAADFQVVTAKCSEVNVHVLPDEVEGTDGGPGAEEPREFPVPEQFVSTFGPDGQLVTVATTHSGA